MASSPSPLLTLPREIREMIYDVLFEDIEYSNLLTSKTAYTPTSCPLLYVDQTISNELYPRLYSSHAIAVPVQEPSKYATGSTQFAPHLEKASRMMKLKTHTIIVEASQTELSYYPDGDVDSDGEPEEAYDFWDDEEGGGEFAEKITEELLSMLTQMPHVSNIKFIFWFGDWRADYRHWRSQFENLRNARTTLKIEVQLNLFDYWDPDAGDTGSNWIQGWDRWCKGANYVSFSAVILNYEEDRDVFIGDEIDPRVWEDEYIPGSYKEQIKALSIGRRECRPLFIKPGPGR